MRSHAPFSHNIIFISRHFLATITAARSQCSRQREAEGKRVCGIVILRAFSYQVLPREKRMRVISTSHHNSLLYCLLYSLLYSLLYCSLYSSLSDTSRPRVVPTRNRRSRVKYRVGRSGGDQGLPLLTTRFFVKANLHNPHAVSLQRLTSSLTSSLASPLRNFNALCLPQAAAFAFCCSHCTFVTLTPQLRKD